MKTSDQILADIERRLTRTWHNTVAAEISAEVTAGVIAAVAAEATTSTDGVDEAEPARAGKPAWPHAFAIGQPSTAELAAGFGALAERGRQWRQWGRDHGIVVNEVPRKVHGATQLLPKDVQVPSVDAAAALLGGDWPTRLAVARRRLRHLVTRYPHLLAAAPQTPGAVPPEDEFGGTDAEGPAVTSAPPGVGLAPLVRTVEALTDLNFDLLCRAADYFVEHGPADGRLTPRQLPIVGLQAKWLNTRQALVAQLAGLPGLGLAPPHPARLHLTYLDPEHRQRGGRRHDCVSVGDTFTPPYPVEVVVISENKDTAVAFPDVPGGISVEGVGRGGGTAAAFDWLTTAPLVVYWGDIDADGLEILDGFRVAGVPARSLLMDEATYEAWSAWGTDLDKNGNPITGREPRPTPQLTPAERALYFRLCGPAPRGPRRLEQERIPFAHALTALAAQVQSSR